MKISFSSRAALALVCTEALLAPGCGVEPVIDPIATDTGNPYGDTNGGEGVTSDGCDQVETPVEPEAPTALGFDAKTIADLVAGDHEHALRWLDSTGFEYGPESGTGPVTLRVEPLGTARLVERSRATSSEGGNLLSDLPDSCRDSLQLDVRIQLETGGGALRESIETTVEAYASDFALATATFELGDLVGSFEAARRRSRRLERPEPRDRDLHSRRQRRARAHVHVGRRARVHHVRSRPIVHG